MVLPVFAGDSPTRVGYAYDRDTDNLLYTENHYETFNDGVLLRSEVIYKDIDENIIAKKTADFSTSQFMPEFSLENIKTGHKEKTRYTENKYEVIFSESQAETQKEALIKYKEDSISDAGFDNFIIAHWDELKAGKKFKREFLVPSMLDFMNFRIYQETVVDKNGRTLRLINIEPNSFFVRVIAGTLKLYYDNNKPALRIFEGVSNMRDYKGDNFNVVIKYKNVEQQTLTANK
jgi:hypothetical protein